MRTAPSDFDSEFLAIGAFWLTIWDAEESGCEMARSFFADYVQDEYNPSLAPDLQRYFAGRRLRQRGLAVDEFVSDEVARNGIGFRFRDRCIRVWKKGDE